MGLASLCHVLSCYADAQAQFESSPFLYRAGTLSDKSLAFFSPHGNYDCRKNDSLLQIGFLTTKPIRSLMRSVTHSVVITYFVCFLQIFS